MIKFLMIFCFTFVLFSADKLNAASQKEEKVYTVQLFSDNSIETAKRLLEKVPAEFKSQTHIYKVDSYFKGRYSQSKSYSTMKSHADKIQKNGFKGAFVVTTTASQMERELISDMKKREAAAPKIVALPEKKEIKESVKKETPKKNIQTQNSKPQINKPDILQKAKSAYQNGNESEAAIYYEQALSGGFANEEAKNNLCYIYGKNGELSKAKKIIKTQRHQSKFIYSYAYGAVESNQKNYYNDMSEYIEADNNGRLTVLTGYYFEKNNNIQKAEDFYKKAYEKNPTDVYNIYAYARLFDIKQNTQAISIYKDIIKSIDNSHPLYDTVVRRVTELEK